MGHIEKRGERAYRITVEWDRDQSGARKQHKETVKGTRRDAERRIRELETARDQGAILGDSRLTTGDWLAEWLNAWRAKPLARKTQRRYAELINLYLLPTIGRVPLAKLSGSDLQRAYQYADEEGRSGTTLLHIHRVLSTALRAAVRAGKVNRNAADMVEAPTASTKKRATLSPAELQEVLSLAAETPYAPLYYLAAATGMREGELLALRWSDIEGDLIHVRRSLDWVNGVGATFKDTKTERERIVSIGPSTVAMLRQHRRDQSAIYELVFTDRRGRPLSPHGGLRSTWNRIRVAVGRPTLRIHDLRHTFASLSLGDGVPVTVVAEQLGHSTSSTTLRVYGHSLRSMQEDAAQRFDRFLSPQSETAVSENA